MFRALFSPFLCICKIWIKNTFYGNFLSQPFNPLIRITPALEVTQVYGTCVRYCNLALTEPLSLHWPIKLHVRLTNSSWPTTTLNLLIGNTTFKWAESLWNLTSSVITRHTFLFPPCHIRLLGEKTNGGQAVWETSSANCMLHNIYAQSFCERKC